MTVIVLSINNDYHKAGEERRMRGRTCGGGGGGASIFIFPFD
jgi:hypothetical protein